MTTYYLDASALAKRYLHEAGSAWILDLTSPDNLHTIIIAEITQVEVAAAIAARQRAPGGISLRQRDAAVDLLAKHMKTEYRLVGTTPMILDRAVRLTQTHRLRGYDSIQLATAIVTHELLLNAGLPGLVFVTADTDLISAAIREGLPSENPLQHH
jgi:predicted nucleic acid-binding protein